MSYSILSENEFLTTVTPNDPRLTFDPIAKVDGLTLMNMYESYGHAVYHGQIIAFRVKVTF